MKPDRWMQLGYNHALSGIPYAYKLNRDCMTEQEIQSYARGYLWSKPTGAALEAKHYPGNIVPCTHDAQWDEGILGFFRLLGKCFGA